MDKAATAVVIEVEIEAETVAGAVAAAGELYAVGYRTPRAMLEAGWQDRVDALGRGRYRRYDERTATMLGDGAALLIDRWHGDMRRLRAEASGDGRQIATLLTAFPGIGPAGADIFLREVQDVWPSVAPRVDAVALIGRPEVLGERVDVAGDGVLVARDGLGDVGEQPADQAAEGRLDAPG